jgi:glycosyltransferase involved in cell wall biosynthesis
VLFRSPRQIPVVSLNQAKGFSLKQVLNLVELIRKERPDIIHNHNPRGQIYGSIASRLAGKKNITTRHGNEREPIPSWVWPFTDRVVLISHETQRSFLANAFIKKSKSTVIHNGIDLGPFGDSEDQAAIRKQWNIPSDAFVICNVARLAPEKNHALLLNAFSRVYKQHPHARLVIVGDGACKDALTRQAEELGIAQYVTFTGFQSNIGPFLFAGDAFVLSSDTEGISLTLLEAMAASKPVVATHVGGNPEVIIDGETGFLVAPRDPNAMADKILLLSKSELRHQMGQAGRKRVEDHFSIDRMAQEYENIYKMICLGKKVRDQGKK